MDPDPEVTAVVRRIEIDPNSRDSRGYTLRGMWDRLRRSVSALLRSNLRIACADAVVAEVDVNNCWVMLAVDWTSIRDDVFLPSGSANAEGVARCASGSGGSAWSFEAYYSPSQVAV